MCDNDFPFAISTYLTLAKNDIRGKLRTSRHSLVFFASRTFPVIIITTLSHVVPAPPYVIPMKMGIYRFFNSSINSGC